MPLRRWILVVEPNDVFREIICAELSQSTSAGTELLLVSQPTDLLVAIKEHDHLPDLVIVEWFAAGNQVRACLEGLRKLAVLHRIRIIAMSAESARQALCEAQALGVRRFVCKQPDENSFRKKIAEAIHEFLPAETRAIA